MINPQTAARVAELAERFRHGMPCRHVCIDDFFAPDVAAAILRDFPSFERTAKRTEFGEDGLKAVHEKLSDISPFYAQLTEYLKSTEFHALIGSISGIEALRWGGESMYGGGTHENVNGAELDAHVDFNFDDRTREHRRLNLLVYMNPEWGAGWGGEFELHSNPRDPAANRISSYAPLFNRAVLMETNEHSWHGFPRIRLPEGKEHLSRKSMALYFYTRERPAEEIRGGHGTFYVQRPLPPQFAPGQTITTGMHREISYLVAKRDAFLALHQQLESDLTGRLTALVDYHRDTLARLRVPLSGWARQIGPVSGMHPDDWVAERFTGTFRLLRPIERVRIELLVPQHARLPLELEVSAGTERACHTLHSSGACEISLPLRRGKGEDIALAITSSTTTSGLAAGINADARAVSVLLLNLAFE